MKISIIKACASSEFKNYKKYMSAPPQSIFSLAASTLKYIEYDLIDETIDMKIDYKTKSELIVIFFSTPDAIHGYKMADKFRKMGKTVILSGLHVKSNRKEALKHADGLIVGESKSVWEELLCDYEYGDLKDIYGGSCQVDLKELNAFPVDKISLSKYNYIWSVLVSR